MGKMTQRLFKFSHILAVLAFVLCSIRVEASPVALEQVQSALGNLAGRNGLVAGGLRGSVPLQPLAWSAETPVFYMADLEGQGWALVSADDALRPIVGWSDEPLPEGDLPPALIDWLQAEEEKVLELEPKAGSSEVASAAWNELLNGGAGDGSVTTYTDVAPMLEARWSQGNPWNNMCPADSGGSGGHVYVGCVAVAMAQVMDYWNWPLQGEYLQSYYHDLYGEISVDFSQQTYDWNAMSPTQALPEVQKLLYHAGVSVRMDYGISGSSASTSNVVTALRSYFRYQDSTRMVWRSAYTPEEWDNLIRAELAEGRPVIYRGQGAVGGHAFDVDGVQDGNWFHINWGWGGSYNGYFLLDDLSPGNWTFNTAQGAVVGIAPEGVAVNHPPVVSPLYIEIQENQTVSRTLTGNDPDGDSVTFKLNGQNLEGSIWTWTPEVNQNGYFSFQYQACDYASCGTAASIYVNVLPTNQAPVVYARSFEIYEGESVSAVLSADDPEDEAVTFKVDGETLAGDAWSWAPAAHEHGIYAFSYQACDPQACGSAALITVTVLPAPIADPENTPYPSPTPEIGATPTPEIGTTPTPETGATPTPEIGTTPTPEPTPSVDPEAEKNAFMNQAPAISIRIRKKKLTVQCSLLQSARYRMQAGKTARSSSIRIVKNGSLRLTYRAGDSLSVSCQGQKQFDGVWVNSKAGKRKLSSRSLRKIART